MPEDMEEIHFWFQDKNRSEVKECKEMHHIKSNQIKTGVAILMLHKTDLKTQFVTRDKIRTLYNDITWGRHKEKNIKCVRQKMTELKGEIDNSTIIGNFSITFSIIEQLHRRSTRNRTLEQQYKLFRPNTYL